MAKVGSSKHLARIFDTHDPDNQAGPILLAILIALVTIVVALAFGMTGHRP